MKLTVQNGYRTETPDGHTVVELIGRMATGTAQYSVAHVTVPAGARGAPRRNRFDEVLIVESGTGVLTANDTAYSLEPQAVIWLPAGTRYAVEANEKEDLTAWAICVPAFRPEWSTTGNAPLDWRAYQVPRGIDRLRPRKE